MLFRQVLTQSFLKDRFEGTLPSNIGMTLLGISLVLLLFYHFTLLAGTQSSAKSLNKLKYSIAVTQQLAFSYTVLFNFVRFALYSWPWFVISQLLRTMQSPAWCITCTLNGRLNYLAEGSCLGCTHCVTCTCVVFLPYPQVG